jgi:formiminotetrahydrofolate cyclodeaminase
MRAFADVIKASGSRGEFPDKYETAMKNATDTLVAILKNCESILTEIEHVFKIAYPKVLGDLAGGACLAEAAAAASKLGVEVNLGLIQDEEYRKRMLSFVRESYKNCVETKSRIVEGISV